jgi:hypothetical protein
MRQIALLSWVPLLAALAHGTLRAEDSGMTTMRFVVVKPVATQTPAARSYAAVAVKLPPAFRDASLDAFRAKIAAVAERRVYAELAGLVTPQGFFWDRDFAGGFSRSLPAVDNLAAAIRLEQHNGAGWNALANFATETTATPLTGRPGIVCAPGEPSFDNFAFDRLLDATVSEARDWAYPRTENTFVRAAPQNEASVVDTLELALVRVLEGSSGPSKADATGGRWLRVATPVGIVGFVAAGALRPLSPQRLCYGRDVFGRWRIAGYVGGD